MEAIKKRRAVKVEALNRAIGSIRIKSTLLYANYNLTSMVVERHAQRYARFTSDETPILAVSDKFINPVSSYGWSGLFITDQAFYYKVIRGSYLFGLVANSVTDFIALDQIQTISIGDNASNGHYVGHQLIINGHAVGLLRLSDDLDSDQCLISQLNILFRAIEG